MKAQAVTSVFLLTLTGCIATTRDVLDLENQTDEIKHQVSTLQKNQADLLVKIDQLHRELSIFNENLKDSQSSMTKLSSKMDDLEAALGQKIESLGETLAKKQAAESAAAAGPAPGQIYQSATLHMAKRNYDLAIQGFELYLSRYPKGELADLVTFKLGEAYFQKKSWENAARQYAAVLDRFPKSDLIPSARLQYARSLIQMKQNLPEAKRYLESIPEDFPKSPEAKPAKETLQKISSPPATKKAPPPAPKKAP